MSTISKTQATSLPQATEAHREQIRRRKARGQFLQRLSLWWTYAVLLILTVIMFGPFLWLISSSLKTVTQYFAVPMQWIPNPAMWSNYVEVFVQYNFLRYILNSVWLATYCMIVTTISSAFVAYGFARFRFPGRDVLFILVLATMMLPSQITSIALYTTFRTLGWIDSYLPMMVPRLFGDPFTIFLFRQFFLGLPRELDEAARIDGCGSLRIWWNVILPQSKPVLIVAAVFAFLGSWRDSWNPLIYLSSNELRTVPLGLLFFSNPYKPIDPQLMAATLVALVVPILLYVVGQRYIDRGVAIAEIK
jgi:ABC-type glycerol-3-phosphate transport system permease component